MPVSVQLRRAPVRVFFSDDGGHTFERLAEDVHATQINFVHFGADDRTLLVEFWPDVNNGGPPTANSPRPTRHMLVIDVAGRARTRGEVELGDLLPWGTAAGGALPLFVDRQNHCIMGVDVAAMKLKELRCFPQARGQFSPHFSPNGTFGTYAEAGPKPFDLVFAMDAPTEPRKITDTFVGNLIGPDDRGRIAWQRTPRAPGSASAGNRLWSNGGCNARRR